MGLGSLWHPQEGQHNFTVTASLVIQLLFFKMRFFATTRASPSKNENVIARLVFGESEQVRALSCSPS